MNRKKYSVYSLYSGSGGNSVYVCADGHEILIDAGKSARSLRAALKAIGTDASNIEAIFITHEHTDHISALEIFEKERGIPVHVSTLSAEKLTRNGNTPLSRNLVFHPPLYQVMLGNVKISSFATPHDSCGSVGYRIEFEDENGTQSFGIATDIGHISKSVETGLLGCRDVIIESNHDLDMLSCGPYPLPLKKRIMSNNGHLSNADCAAFVAKLCSEGAKNILLAHLSAENNTPEAALSETVSAVADPSVHIGVADSENPVRLI